MRVPSSRLPSIARAYGPPRAAAPPRLRSARTTTAPPASPTITDAPAAGDERRHRVERAPEPAGVRHHAAALPRDGTGECHPPGCIGQHRFAKRPRQVDPAMAGQPGRGGRWRLEATQDHEGTGEG